MMISFLNLLSDIRIMVVYVTRILNINLIIDSKSFYNKDDESDINDIYSIIKTGNNTVDEILDTFYI